VPPHPVIGLLCLLAMSRSSLNVSRVPGGERGIAISGLG